MKGNLFKKGLAVATSLLMLAGGVSELPFAGVFEDMAITASAETEITYIDADGISQTISDYTWNCQEKCSQRIPKICNRQVSGGMVSQPG